MTLSHEEQYQRSWQERQEIAENMQPIIGRLYRNKAVELVVYGKPLVNATTIDIIKAHKTVERFEQQKLRLRESFPVLEAISKLNLAPGRIDLGKLAFAYTYKNAAGDLSLQQCRRTDKGQRHECDENDRHDHRDVSPHTVPRLEQDKVQFHSGSSSMRSK